MKEEKRNIGYGIRSIQETSFHFSPPEHKPAPSAVGVGISYTLSFVEKDNSANVVIDITYLNNKTKDEYCKISILNAFEIIELKKYKQKEDYDLPIDFIALIVGISISHTRAILSTKTRGTVLGEFILPILNPKEIVEKSNIKSKKG